MLYGLAMVEPNQAVGTAAAAAEHVVEELDMCCKKAKCPRVQVLSSGDVLVRDDDAGAVPVRFTAEQAGELRRLLERRSY